MKKGTTIGVGLLLGLLCGVFCWWSAIFFLQVPFTLGNLFFLMLNRMGLGLAVALGHIALEGKWYLRGPMIAFVIGLCVTYFYYLSSLSRHLMKNILSLVIQIWKLFYFGLKFSVKSVYKSNTLC